MAILISRLLTFCTDTGIPTPKIPKTESSTAANLPTEIFYQCTKQIKYV